MLRLSVGGIFISYRRVDSRVYAGRLFDRLRRHFGEDRVFMDVEGGIGRGELFPEAIDRALKSAAAVVVVIGRQWLTCTDSHGTRRIEHANDWVRGEISVALSRGILLLPVLVDGASMPPSDELPEEVRSFTRRQASEISDIRWDYDVGEIIKALEPAVSTRLQENTTLFLLGVWLKWGSIGVVGIAIVSSVVIGLYRKSEPTASAGRPETRAESTSSVPNPDLNNGAPKVRQGKLGTFIARLSRHSDGDRQFQLEGIGLPVESTVRVRVWKGGKEVVQPTGNVDRTDLGEWRYKWITVNEDGEYWIEVQRTGEGANTQLPQQFVVGVGPNYVPSDRLKRKVADNESAEPLSTIADNKHILLNVPDVLQQKSAWAAPAVMMALGRYFGKGPTSQAEWAQALNGTMEDVPAGMKQIVALAGEIGLKTTLFTSALSEADVKSTISSGGLVLCRIGWPSGGGHFVLISGYIMKDVGALYHVMDPFYGSQTVSTDTLRTSYRGTGSWTGSVIFKSD